MNLTQAVVEEVADLLEENGRKMKRSEIQEELTGDEYIAGYEEGTVDGAIRCMMLAGGLKNGETLSHCVLYPEGL